MNKDKIDEAVLALLYLGIHEGRDTQGRPRVWKGFDWDAMGRLHERGFMSDPATKARSVELTEDGLREAEAACRRLFDGRDETAG